jgi:hypothetical protein
MAICNACGAWLEPAALVRDGAAVTIVCPHCGYREPFPQYPLWWVTGSSGSGKSTLLPHLRRALPEFVVFDGEAIDFWRFDGPPGDYSSLYNQWLKVVHQIALHGHRVVCVATALPEQIAACSFRHYFWPIRFLGLVCPEAAQRARLLARPAWRRAGSPEFIAQACGYTRRLEELGGGPSPQLALLDTAADGPETGAARLAAWVRASATAAGAARAGDLA